MKFEYSKNIEDATHLWGIFKDKPDMELFNGFAKRLIRGKKKAME